MENRIKLKDSKDAVRKLAIDVVHNMVSQEELESIQSFIKNKDPKKEYHKYVFGKRIGDNIMRNYGIFETVAAMVTRENSRREFFCTVKKIVGFKTRLMERKSNSYALVSVDLREPLFLMNGQFSNFSAGMFEEMLSKDVKKRIHDFLKDSIEVDKFYTRGIPIFEAVYDDSVDIVLRNNSNFTGMVVRDAEVIGRTGIFGGVLEYCEFFENNKKNTDFIIKFIKKNGLFNNIQKYQFSKEDILKQIVPSLKRKRSHLGMASLYFREKADMVMKLLESQKSVDFDVLQSLLESVSDNDKALRKIKNNKRIRKKFENDPRSMLLLMLQ